MVVSVTEKVLKKHQVWVKETNEREPLLKCRKWIRWRQNWGVMLLQDGSGGSLLTGQVASGIEVA
jgi:hypothetical protein